jgi:hypothetical protein
MKFLAPCTTGRKPAGETEQTAVQPAVPEKNCPAPESFPDGNQIKLSKKCMYHNFFLQNRE